MIPSAPALIDPKRSAHATLRGYLYQACLGVVRWLDLKDDEALLCEGNEDLDLFLCDGTLCVQVKAYSGKLGIADQAVVESLRQFLRSYVTFRRQGEPRRFLFTTTASQRRSRKRGLDFDLLADWQKGDRSPAVCTAVKRLLVEGDDIPAWLAEPVADLDTGQGWPGFLDAVEWKFNELDLEGLRDKILKKLSVLRPELKPKIFCERLVAEVLDASIKPKAEDRFLTRACLNSLAETTHTELAEWAKSPAAARIHEAFEINRLLHANAADLPENPTPGKLLTAAYEVIPFEEEGRRGELDALEAWCGGTDRRSVLLLTGDGGSGKTRLALEWCRRLRHQGWHAGFLRQDRTEKDLDPLLEGVPPRLIVVDYAETRLSVVQPLLYKMGIDSHGGGPQVRLLLLARRAGDWWTELTSGTVRREIEDLLARSPQPHSIAPLVPAAEERRKVYDAALTAFADELGKAVPNDPPVAHLEKNGFEQVLYLHMAALAALDGRSVGSAADALARTLDHERWLWSQQVEELGLDRSLKEAVQDAFGRAVAALTLVGGAATEPQARTLLGRVLDGFPARPDLMTTILRSVRRLYGDAATSRFIDPLQPDILGEELVAKVLQQELHQQEPGTLKKLLDGATIEEGHTLLTVLTRLAQRMPAAEKWLQASFRAQLSMLAESALDVAVETGDPIGLVLAREIEENAGEELAERLMDRCDEDHYRSSLPLREVALAATARKRRIFAQLHPPRRGLLALLFRRWQQPPALEEQARLAINLGNRLSELGRREEALKATEEAAASFSNLARRRPGAFLPELAMSLNNLGKMLSELGRRKEALKATEKAVAYYRDLAGQRPDASLPGLAMSLNNLGATLSGLGRREEALKAMEEAVAYYRDLAGRRPDAFLPELANSLNNLGAMLSALERREEALKATKEAAALSRDLAGRRPDAYLPNLAASLNNLVSDLSYLDRLEEALKAAEESVAIYRDLAGRRPDAFLPNLANSLNNLGEILGELDRLEDTLKVIEEATRILAPFFLWNPDAFDDSWQRMARNYLRYARTLGQEPHDDVYWVIIAGFSSRDETEPERIARLRQVKGLTRRKEEEIEAEERHDR